jgi:predicted Zn-dependent protease
MDTLRVNAYIAQRIYNSTEELSGFGSEIEKKIVIKANTGSTALIAHEWGHVLGLDDRNEPNVVMNHFGFGAMVNQTESNKFLGQ